MKRLTLALVLTAFAAPGAAFGQVPPAPAPAGDTIAPVTITARPTPDKADVIANRMPRVARCLTPDGHSPDPTSLFNQAYYQELTGEADYYAQIRKPPAKVRRRYPPPIHPGERIFANLDSSETPGGRGADAHIARPSRPYDYPTCLSREAMEKSAPFARALALYDKGEYEAALKALLAVHGTLGASPMAGEVALMIAEAYLKGEGTPKDVAQGVAWLKKAARTPGSNRLRPRYDPENPGRFHSITGEAAMALARLHIVGDGVEKDPALIREWIRTAAFAQHIPARKILADMDYSGYAGRQNQRDARMNYEFAGDLRHAEAQFSAAEMYDLGEGGYQSRRRALDLYSKAGQLGSMPATYALAVAYDKGAGVPSNAERALTLYKIAAVGGVAAAQTAIGTYFYEGGSPLGKDPRQARAWFAEAASRGDVDGMVNLAAMLTRGEGGEADLVRAWAWLSIAREGGREDVAAGIAALEGRMTAPQLAEAKALLAPEAAG